MNHAPVRGDRECEFLECLCVGRALVRVTSRLFPAIAAATADAQIFRPIFPEGTFVLFPK